MPAFEGLFGVDWDSRIQDLLFTLCYWHGLAKLRMHSDTTLKLLNTMTTRLGNSLRFFANITCQHFDTFETPAEKAAWARAGVHAARKAGMSSNEVNTQPPKDAGGPRQQVYNMNTFKIHELGHYSLDIRDFGTTDSYSTQIVGFPIANNFTI